MEYIVTGKEMKQIDQYTIEQLGIPSLVLMERAALSVAESIMEQCALSDRILCVCGAGNNGGDAIAIARILYCKGHSVWIYMAGSKEKWTKETQLQYEIAIKLGITELRESELDHRLSHTSILVDGLFGIGLNSDVRVPFDQLIDKINRWHEGKRERLIWSVDIPSGICSETGKILGKAIKADHTITFGYNKSGLLLYPGKDHAGSCLVADIGFSVKSLETLNPKGFAYNSEDLKKLPKRWADSNKGTYGKVLVIAGSKNMSGAAFLCAKAACYAGSGLVRILTSESNRIILQSQLPQAMISTWEDDVEKSLIFQWADVVVLGPGIGTSKKMIDQIRGIISEIRCPLILDADGLNLLALHHIDLKNRNIPVIVTPHMGEMSRLMNVSIKELKMDRIKYARAYAISKKQVCVLKDSSTVVSDGEQVYYNTSGNEGMATGGSGDVLAGVIASFVGQGMDAFDAACMGVYVHGLAGDYGKVRYGSAGMTSVEIIEGLREVLKYKKEPR